LELTPTLIGVLQVTVGGRVAGQMGVGGTAVPTGVSTPEVWSTENPETVLLVSLATYTKVFAGVNASATGRGLVPKEETVKA
jgi:hypothetical protein